VLASAVAQGRWFSALAIAPVALAVARLCWLGRRHLGQVVPSLSVLDPRRLRRPSVAMCPCEVQRRWAVVLGVGL
jgi:hypothetical protein